LKKSNLKFFICATEQSGENLAHKIIKEIKLKIPKSKFAGVAGTKTSKFFYKKIYSTSDFKSIGIIELFGSIRKYIKMIDHLSEVIIKEKFDFVITFDSPDFNYRLAKKIKSKKYLGKAIHFVAPTVWAWRKNRAKLFSKVYDKLFTILPFENKYFEKYNLSTTFIGHPIYYLNKSYKYKYKYNKKSYIAFLPGSRETEIKSLMRYFDLASKYLYENKYNFKIFIPTLPHLKKLINHHTLNWTIKPEIITDSKLIEKKFKLTYFAIVCSGTASLEITLRKIPQLVIYKLNIFTEIILKLMSDIRYANLINILSSKMIIPEITNSNLNDRVFIKSLSNLINNYKFQYKSQIIGSKKYINKFILKKSPSEISIKEIKNYFFQSH
tara:strand:- start:11528 stop:12673 length:1146 start_codon:yes stop_codon:yes gene_type:complete